MLQRLIALSVVAATLLSTPIQAEESAAPFGEKFLKLDRRAVGEWWKLSGTPANSRKRQAAKRFIEMNVPRDEVVAFAVYTHDAGTLKLTAQLFPLMPDESRDVRLELNAGDGWKLAATEKIQFPGWSAHFRINNWDSTKDVKYRVRHGKAAMFEGLIRHDPIEKDEIVIGSLSCNSTRTPGPRPMIVENLKHQDPDMLFFAGDQTYHHTEHTMGWLQFGLQFREVLKDRPVVTIPDDHDVGQGNLWGEGGIKGSGNGDSGGFIYPAEYVNMVQRHQTWHLPDPVNPKPLAQGIGVYYTRLRVGGIDFAIIEDRKFKTGPNGKIPRQGPRPDHIRNPEYDPKSVDLPHLVLLGKDQLDFLHEWGQDWTGADMKCVLSQTAFCGAVHNHGSAENRLHADLDCNGWPQTGRNKALREIRRAWASHLCGDQHLAVVVKHGIDSHGDGPMGFTNPAIINTIYGRWWQPLDEKPGPNPVPNSPLPWTGDFRDGLDNKISMIAYANPPADRSDETKRADGYGLVRFNKKTGKTVFECWHRFANVAKGDKQFPGWPVEFNMADNDGRKETHQLPEVKFDKPNQVVQVINDADGEILYTVRARGKSFTPAVYAAGTYTVKVGPNKPSKVALKGAKATKK